MMKARTLAAGAVVLAALLHAHSTSAQQAAPAAAVTAPGAAAAPAAPADVKASAAPAEAKAAAQPQTVVMVPREPSPTEQFIRDGLLIAVLVLIIYAGFLLFVFARAVSAGERIAVQSQWGGFGSGVGGWRMSTSLSALVGAFVVLLFAAYLAGSLLRDNAPLPDKDRKEKAAGAASAEPKN